MPYDPVRDSASSYPSTIVRPSSSSSASSASVAFPPPSPSFAHSAPPAISPTNLYSSGTPWPAAPGASSPLEYFQARPRPEQTKRLSLADLCGPGTSTSSPPPSHHSSLSPHVATASVPGFSAGPPHPPAFSLTTTPSRLAPPPPPPPTHPGHASTSSPAIPEGFSSEHALAPSSSNFIKAVPMSRRKDSTGSIASSNGGGGGDGSRRSSKGALELSPSSSTRMLSGAGPVLSYPAVTVGDSSASRRNGAGGHEHLLSTSNSDGRRLSSSSSASSPTTVASTLLLSTTSRPTSPATQTSAASARPPSSSSSSSSSLHNLLSGPSSQFQEQRQKIPSVAPPPRSSSPPNLSLAPALPSPLSPSSPMPVPYAPNRKTRPSSILNAIPLEVYDSLRRQVVPEGSKNVLRGRALGTNKGREREIEKVLSSEGASRPGSASSSGGYGVGGGAGAGGGGAAGQQQRPSGGSRPSSSGEVDQRMGKRKVAEDEFGREVRRKGDDSQREEDEQDHRGGTVSVVSQSGDVAAVADHYNARPEVGREKRKFSPIIGLKSFNNWVKSVLFAKFGRPGGPRTNRHSPPYGNVLDLGCGKGGDLLKWNASRIRKYVGFDIADISVQQCRQRAADMRVRCFDYEVHALDCYTAPITSVIPEQQLRANPFDVVSMQFCAHYAFESEAKVRQMLENVATFLKPGGYYTGTVPNRETLLTSLMSIPDGEPLEFGNACYDIKFDTRDEFPIYGHRYSFYLQDAVEDVPEYLVEWDNFERLAGEYGLDLVYKRDFRDIFEEERETPELRDLLTRMKVLDDKGISKMDADEWECATLYMGFAFEKRH